MTPLLITVLISIVNINCHVINRTKLDVLNLPKENVQNVEGDKDGVSVYLEDVLFSIANQNWTDDEKPCLDDIHRMLLGLQNFTLWAVWVWDAQASEPQGLLFGNRYQLGNYDQCMNAPWASSHPELSTKYCLADIRLERTDTTVRKRVNNPFNPYQSALDYIQYRPPHSHPLNELTWGACLPTSCMTKSVDRLLRIMLARSHLGTAGLRANISVTEPCQTKNDWEYDGSFYAFIATAGVLVCISLICTFTNVLRKNTAKNSTTSKLLNSFCIKENANDLMKTNKGGLEVFYGIKFLTMCIIVLDHQIGNKNAGPISDGYISDETVKSFVGMLLLHDDLFVDTFFFLSGFLATTYLACAEKMPNPFLIILKRYIRMVVSLAAVIFYTCSVLPYTGSGPLWKRVSSVEADLCRQNWWLNLLMVNNYVDSEHICLVVSWYIPCDFHFFVVVLLLIWVMRHNSSLGIILGGLVTVASVIVPGMVTYVYELSAVQLFTYEFISDPRANPEFHGNYIKSHTRFAAYLVGVFAGYFYVMKKDRFSINKISKVWSIFGSLSALVLMLVIMLSGNIFLWWNYAPFEGAVYSALNRPAWACSLALLVMCCVFGQVPLIKGCLTWYPWVPLSRLTYGMYLTHILIIMRNVYSTRNPDSNDYFNILNETAGVIFFSCVASLLLWLFAEAPANKLLTLCLMSMIKKPQDKQKDDNENHINEKPSTSTATSQNSKADIPPLGISSKI